MVGAADGFPGDCGREEVPVLAVVVVAMVMGEAGTEGAGLAGRMGEEGTEAVPRKRPVGWGWSWGRVAGLAVVVGGGAGVVVAAGAGGGGSMRAIEPSRPNRGRNVSAIMVEDGINYIAGQEKKIRRLRTTPPPLSPSKCFAVYM